MLGLNDQNNANFIFLLGRITQEIASPNAFGDPSGFIYEYFYVYSEVQMCMEDLQYYVQEGLGLFPSQCLTDP